jgi:hypothetical protein
MPLKVQIGFVKSIGIVTALGKNYMDIGYSGDLITGYTYPIIIRI